MATPRNNTYTAPSGTPVYAGQFSLSRDVAMIGDSLTTHLLGYNWSPFFWINGLAANGGQRLLANSGISGNTVAMMLARVNNNYLDGTPGLAGLPPLGIIYIRAGTNDARATTPIASLTATYTSLLTALRAYATRVVILSVPPIGAADGGDFALKNQRTLDYNAWLSSYAAANPTWCTYVDDSTVLRNPDGSQIAAYFQDGVHNNGTATYLQGKAAAAALSALFTTFNYYNPVVTSNLEVYPAKPQWVTNPAMAGTYTGTGNWPGTFVSGYSISSNGAGVNGTVSVVAAEVGDTNQSPWQRVTPAQVTKVGSESIRIVSTLAGRAISTTDPSMLDMMVEIRLNSFDTSKFSTFRLWVQGNTGAKITPDLDLKLGGGVVNERVVLRHAMPRIGPTAQTSAVLYFDLLVNSSFTGSMGSFDFRCCTIKG